MLGADQTTNVCHKYPTPVTLYNKGPFAELQNDKDQDRLVASEPIVCSKRHKMF
jgi:hypothetical protein